jgi:regulatory protein
VRNDLELLEKAIQYSFLLLKFRQRSEKEIRERLKRKKFALQVIEKTIEFLKEKNFLDDESFAELWLESRINSLGPRRLKQQLRLKGIDDNIIEAQLKKIIQDHPESQRIEEIIKDKLNKFKGIDSHKAKRRIYAYLIRHGFSPDAVIDGVSQIPAQADQDN